MHIPHMLHYSQVLYILILGTHMQKHLFSAQLLLLIGFSTPSLGQDSTYAAQYLKHEYMIPMRDGVRLSTAVYTPRDTSSSCPIMLMRTPYSIRPYGETKFPQTLGPSDAFDREGFVFVHQDVRGTYMSEGTFENVRPHNEAKRSMNDIDESTDTFDTIDWLVKNVPRNNGRVGMWGISYPGFYASAGSINAHPALKAVSPQAPIADWFLGDDDHHNGSFFLLDNFLFSAGFDRLRKGPTPDRRTGFSMPTADAYEFLLQAGPSADFNNKYFGGEVPYWDSLVVHNTYDAYWQARNLAPHLRNLPSAMLIVGGWFDAEDLYGTLHTFDAMTKQCPATYTTLVMGPWAHGAWEWSDGTSLGSISFGSPTAEYFREHIELPFFLHNLKGGTDPTLPHLLLFETGTNVWHSYATWPPPNARLRKLYLTTHNILSSSPPHAGSRFDEYISDPQHPVPYIQGISGYRPAEFMVSDQRFASRRTDVLSYQTAPLDTPLTVAGPITVRLFVSSTGKDCDWVVKLIDMFPDTTAVTDTRSQQFRLTGYQMLLRAEIMPSRFRKSYEHPEPLVPGAITNISFPMNDVNHAFLAGHRIMVQVQSSWYPLVDRNPQQFIVPHRAAAEDMRSATQRVYHETGNASRIEFFVLPRKTL